MGCGAAPVHKAAFEIDPFAGRPVAAGDAPGQFGKPLLPLVLRGGGPGEVGAGDGEGRGDEPGQHEVARAGGDDVAVEDEVGQGAPAGVEADAVAAEGRRAVEAGAGDDFAGGLAAPGARAHGAAVADVAALRVHDDVAAQGDVGLGGGLHGCGDGGEGAGQVLFVAVEVGGDVRLGGHVLPGAVDGGVHAFVGRAFVAEAIAGGRGMGGLPLGQPGGGAVRGAAVLHVVVHGEPLPRLVGD